MPESDKFFPSIRCVVDKADLVPKNGEQSVLDGATVSANEDRPLEEIESLCMKCGEQVHPSSSFVSTPCHFVNTVSQGITRMLLTSIPFFREVIIMSFRCEHCGSSNNEIQSAGSIRRASSNFGIFPPCAKRALVMQPKARSIPLVFFPEAISTDKSSDLHLAPSSFLSMSLHFQHLVAN